MSREELDHIRGRHTRVRAAGHGPVHQSLSTLARDWRYWCVAVVLLANNVTVWGYFAWAPSYFVQAHHMSLFAAAATLSVLALVMGVCFNALGGWIQDRTDRRAVVAAICGGLLSLSLWVGLTLKNPILSALCFVFSLTPSGQMGAASQAMAVNLIDRPLLGRGTGLMNTVTQTLTAGAPALMGVVIGAAGGAVAAGFFFILGIGVVGGLAGLALAWQGF